MPSTSTPNTFPLCNAPRVVLSKNRHTPPRCMHKVLIVAHWCLAQIFLQACTYFPASKTLLEVSCEHKVPDSKFIESKRKRSGVPSECCIGKQKEPKYDSPCAFRVVDLELFIASHGVRFRAADMIELMIPINEKAGRCKILQQNERSNFWNKTTPNYWLWIRACISKTHLDPDLSSIPWAGSWKERRSAA